MNLFRRLTSALFCIAAVLVSSCSEPQPKRETKQAQADTSLPEYTVLTDATYPPFEFYDQHGDILGLDVDLLNAIAADQGFRLTFRHQNWDDFFQVFQTSQADIAAAALTIEEAVEHGSISSPYYDSPYRIAAIKPEILSDRLWKNKMIAVPVNDDTGEYIQEQYGLGRKQLKQTDTLYLALTAVARGEAEAAAGDSTVMRYYMNSPTFKNNGYQFASEIFLNNTAESTNMVFLVRKDRTELLEKINKGLENLKKNGKYKTILQKWRQEE